MRYGTKPVRRCHACPLNRGDSCWLFVYPRGQWREGRSCAARDDQEIHEAYWKWERRPVVKSRKELRREFFRVKQRKVIRRLVRR
jgi:hypothetical protein